MKDELEVLKDIRMILIAIGIGFVVIAIPLMYVLGKLAAR